MATPSPVSSPLSDSNPNSASPPPHQIHPLSISGSSPPPHITVVALAASTSAVARKTQPVLWTNDETFLLIESFKDKWYSVCRGPLKTTHWEEIAVAVSARSGVERSSTQCRHKIEKMRKRFRQERQSMGPISIWPFYYAMEELDTSPAPISARPLTRLPPRNYQEEEEDDDDQEDEEEDDYEEDPRQNKSRSINHILRRPGTVNRYSGVGVGVGVGIGVGGGMLSWGQRQRSKRKRDDQGGERRRKGGKAVAAEIRGFAERVMVMERKKMEFARETVKLRKEMENKRIQLIQSSQAQLLQFLNTVFDSY